MPQKKHIFDLDLFIKLNEEYQNKPVVPQPRKTGTANLEEAAKRRIDNIDKLLNVRGKRVLEVGCGLGSLSYVLAKHYGCEVVGVDIVHRDWSDYNTCPNLELRLLDVSADDLEDIGRFDVIYSSAVWEHIKHPYAALRGAKRLLKSDGRFFLSANLYRGPQASHRYREVFFPWPHLLFTDDVFEEFYLRIGRKPNKPAWVNKLTYSGYRHYFELVGFDIQREWFFCLPFDEEFYSRFEDVLSRYPKTDLERDFLNAILVQAPSSENGREGVTKTNSEISARGAEIPATKGSAAGDEQKLQTTYGKLRKVEQKLRDERNKVQSIQDSLRWRAGTLLVDSARRPWRLARLPFDLLRLAMSHRRMCR